MFAKKLGHMVKSMIYLCLCPRVFYSNSWCLMLYHIIQKAQVSGSRAIMALLFIFPFYPLISFFVLRQFFWKVCVEQTRAPCAGSKAPYRVINFRWKVEKQVEPYQKYLDPLPNNKNLDSFRLKAFADDKTEYKWKIEILFRKGRKQCGKRRKCWLPAFSPLPTLFSTALCLRVVKSRDHVVKS